ncbi:hypothetical protein VB773_08870 [Haloarculaceae archaeon H-GB2-1]|nr:hypothetical protein [Haloarculaceae archaeon H-GB11]MEA5407668.1 hypothetical protein [Haloarculaceae archaeon H-GB2-1]
MFEQALEVRDAHVLVRLGVGHRDGGRAAGVARRRPEDALSHREGDGLALLDVRRGERRLDLDLPDDLFGDVLDEPLEVVGLGDEPVDALLRDLVAPTALFRDVALLDEVLQVVADGLGETPMTSAISC